MIDPTDYVELHCHSYYSLLDGTSSPHALVQQAAAQGMTALALMDHNALHGAPELAAEASIYRLKAIFGAELTLAGGYHLTLLVQDEVGWRNLCNLITLAQANTPKGQACSALNTLDTYNAGLIALTGCRQGLVTRPLLAGDEGEAAQALGWLRERFEDRLYVEVQHHRQLGDSAIVKRLVALAAQVALPIVATNNVHYAAPTQAALQDVLCCIRTGKTISQSRTVRRRNTEYYLKDSAAMHRLFGEIPKALLTTRAIAERCDYQLPTGLQPLPTYPVPLGESSASHLEKLCRAALATYYPNGTDAAASLLSHEINIITRAGLENYFLVVWDVIRFCGEANILIQGRGSACNSIVAYLLGISPLDPIRFDLTFERFLSDERPTVPDIDLDIQADRRDEVIQYTYERWGRAATAMACTFIRYGGRSALRDVAKVLEIPESLVAAVSRVLDGRSVESLARSPELQELAASGQSWQNLIILTQQMSQLPRHLGLHNGGMVVMDGLLQERIPIEPTAYPHRHVVQWDKEQLEAAGIAKLDLLGLRMLSVLAEAVQGVVAEVGQPLQWESLPLDDPAVYQMISAGDTIGIFQLESRAQAQMLPRLQPRCFEDLIVAISLIRPGPILGNMVHPFLRRRSGEETVTYLHPTLEPILSETLGVILFQEQVLTVTHALTGLSLGQGEQLRRAIGKNSPHLERLAAPFFAGARERGVKREVAQAVWEQLRAFGGYAFPKSHAGAFAMIVYRSAWLKRYFPAPFFMALLNNQPMGFWSPRVLVGDAKRHGVGVLRVDVNRSGSICTMRGQQLRLGFVYVKGLGMTGGERIVTARGTMPFSDLSDFCRRTRLARSLVEALIIAGAMDDWGPRRTLLWQLRQLAYPEDAIPLDIPSEEVTLPELSELESHLWERETLGLAPGPHIMAFFRERLQADGILDSKALERTPAGRTVRVAGEVVVHQAPPTAKGVHFLSLEDEYGLINLVVQVGVYQQYRAVLRRGGILVVTGEVQRRGMTVNVGVRGVEVLRGTVNH